MQGEDKFFLNNSKFFKNLLTEMSKFLSCLHLYMATVSEVSVGLTFPLFEFIFPTYNECRS